LYIASAFEAWVLATRIFVFAWEWRRRDMENILCNFNYNSHGHHIETIQITIVWYLFCCPSWHDVMRKQGIMLSRRNQCPTFTCEFRILKSMNVLFKIIKLGETIDEFSSACTPISGHPQGSCTYYCRWKGGCRWLSGGLPSLDLIFPLSSRLPSSLRTLTILT